jgi:His/Glu/Gln/Arg/opine family amino acid ABC transporter permease subunit
MDFESIWNYFPVLFKGLQATALISLAALSTSLVMGVVLVVLGRSQFRAIRILTRVYTEIILGIPVLVLVYVIFFVFPEMGIRLSPINSGVLALTLYYAPYMAEAIRGAVNAVPEGQIEAGLTVGMSRWQIGSRVIAPQAIGVALPVLTGIAIGLCKDTAILSVISVVELAFQTKQVVARTYAPFETYIVVAAMYWCMLSLFEFMMRMLERRMTAYRMA